MLHIMEEIGPIIRSHRISQGLTLEHAAKLANVTRKTVYHVESAMKPNCSIDVVERICAAVGLQLGVRVRGTNADQRHLP